MLSDQPPNQPLRLLYPHEVKTALTRGNPNYGKDFTEKEWGEITLRLEQLARLFWEMSIREPQAGNEASINEPIHHQGQDP